MTDDPGRLIPLAKPRELGLGVEIDGEVDYLMRTDMRFPPVYKIRGKNFIIASDRDAYRAELLEEALREAGCGVRTARAAGAKVRPEAV